MGQGIAYCKTPKRGRYRGIGRDAVESAILISSGSCSVSDSASSDPWEFWYSSLSLLRSILVCPCPSLSVSCWAYAFGQIVLRHGCFGGLQSAPLAIGGGE